jgi:hypothetical protein
LNSLRNEGEKDYSATVKFGSAVAGGSALFIAGNRGLNPYIRH